MKTLSLFDGIACARVALERAGFTVDKYYASEVDKYAIQIAQKNYPDITQIGDVRRIKALDFMIKGVKIDLIIGGSPCQDLSAAGKMAGLEGKRSGLFYEYVRLIQEIRPRFFILENVASMKKEWQELISKELWGIKPVMINAALVSAQNRKRLFWVGQLEYSDAFFTDYKQVKISQPKDREILLRDILEPKADACMVQKARGFNKGGIKALNGKTPTISSHSWEQNNKLVTQPVKDKLFAVRSIYNKTLNFDKSNTLGSNSQYQTAKTGQGLVDFEKQTIRRLTPIECERLQGLPDDYTDGISNTQRYKALGNAFNVDVVAHILKVIRNKL